MPVENYSSFAKLVGIYAKCVKYINLLKSRVKMKRDNLASSSPVTPNFYGVAANVLIRNEQFVYFPEIFELQ